MTPASHRLLVFIYMAVILCTVTCEPPENMEEAVRKTLPELSTHLQTGVLQAFYPAVIDRDSGGYFSNFDAAWVRMPDQPKMIVTQARHLWTLSEAAHFFDNDSRFAEFADHGFRFLADAMWDKQQGGFYWITDRAGQPTGDGIKQTYGQAFGIYALAAYYALRRDTAALHLAQSAFNWVEAHAWDPEHGGYHGFLTREGIPLTRADARLPDRAAFGLKDQNVMIHMLEALTALYQVWPDSLVAQRLVHCLELIRDTIAQPEGYLHLYFYNDWTPYSLRDSSEDTRKALHYYLDHVSGGHDVETAFLLLDAAAALGISGDAYHKTLTVGQRMLNHCLDNLWDAQHGGIYEQGYYYQPGGPITIIDNRKNWWAQAEGLNAWLLFSELFPDEPRYPEAYLKQWQYIRTWVADPAHKGWYPWGLDTYPQAATLQKAHIWKAAYHDGRSLMHCIRRLQKRKG